MSTIKLHSISPTASRFINELADTNKDSTETADPDTFDDNSDETANEPYSFLSFPAEIRNLIYRLLLVSPSALITSLRQLTALNHSSRYILSLLPLHPALLSTCRRIYNEGTPILYAENSYTAHSSLLTSMPYMLDPSRPIHSLRVLSHISRWYLHVRLDCDARYDAKTAERAFNECEELDIEASEASFRGAGHGVLMVFKGVRGVRRARVSGSGIDREVCTWLEGAMMAPVGQGVEEFEVWKGKKEGTGRVEVKWDAWGDGNR